jgi:hypothetical protein
MNRRGRPSTKSNRGCDSRQACSRKDNTPADPAQATDGKHTSSPENHQGEHKREARPRLRAGPIAPHCALGPVLLPAAAMRHTPDVSASASTSHFAACATISHPALRCIRTSCSAETNAVHSLRTSDEWRD